MMFISVDLPAPFWPTSPSTRPAPSASETSASTGTPKKLLPMPSRLRTTSLIAARSATSRARSTSSSAAARMIAPFTTSMWKAESRM